MASDTEVTWEALMAGCGVSDDLERLRATPICGSTSAATWNVYQMQDGSTVIATSLEAAMRTTPPKQLGWEGHGPRPADGISGSELAYAELVAASERQINAVKGEIVADAMTAMHAQRRSDGRPVPYLPEEHL